jgi:phosphotransferase system enzyme I (PtsI)
VGTGKKILEISNGDFILVDGDLGEVIVNPDEDAQKDYEARRKLAHAQSRAELEVADEPAITTDGHHVEVVANVGNVADTESALNYGAEGIGLLRTEFIYLDREDAPDEDEQYKAYNDILGLMQDRPVVVRTIDVGGDKELPYLDLGEEANPFLGWRAIRMCLDRPDFFKIQLRALLRASPDHDLRIMFPMISTLEEVRCARSLLAEARDEVLKQGHDVAENIQIGIMVEIPSVVVMADQFAKEVDFFSIGTNDLTQYTMAAERVNEKLSGLNDPCHPAILRQIKRVIETAHDEGIWVGLCGEMAGDPIATPILLGLGLDEFSMAPISIPHIKAIIRCLDLESANQLAAEVVLMDSAEDVRKHVHQFQKSNLV